MKHIRFLIPLFFIFYILFLGIWDLYNYSHMDKSNILTTPHGLALFPLHWQIPFAHYLMPVQNIETTLDWKVALYSFSPILASVFIYTLIATFLYFFTRLRRLEKSFIFHAFSLSFLYVTLFPFLINNEWTYFFYVTILSIHFFFLFHFHSILGFNYKSIYYAIPILCAVLFPAFFLPQTALQEIQIFYGVFLLGLALCIYVMVSLFFYIRRNYAEIKNKNREVISRLILSFVFLPNLFGILIFVGLFLLKQTPMMFAYNSLLFFPAIYVMLFFWLTIRFRLIFFDIPVQYWFLRFVYFVFFSFSYWFSIGYIIAEVPMLIDKKWIHFILISFFLVIIDPVRTLFYFFVNRIFILRRTNLENSLGRFTQEIQSTRNFSQFLDKTINLIKDGLMVYDVKVLLNKEAFPNVRSATLDILYLQNNHPIWGQTEISKKNKKDFLYYTQVSVGPAREILQKYGGFLIMFFRNFKAALIVYDKKDSGLFLSEDIKFLNEVFGYIEPILQNYRYLNMSFMLKKQEHLLEETSKIQKKIQPTFFEDNNIRVYISSQAFQKVSGDYFDFITLSKNTYLFFLGDVSGHGLGSGYIQAVIRSLIRGLFKAFEERTNIERIFNMASRFLSDHYRGSDFMTLFGLTLTFQEHEKNKSIRMEYINAGQHYPYIYLKDKQEFISFSETQQVLGFFAQTYKSNSSVLHENIRVFLYSDGAFESFNNEGNVMGEKRLKEWIAKSVYLEVPEQMKFLQEKIYNSKDFTLYDDLSLLILETNI